jgi:L-ascorbate metabolism protein UlaG (beta-lactamase superfamily)
VAENLKPYRQHMFQPPHSHRQHLRQPLPSLFGAVAALFFALFLFASCNQKGQMGGIETFHTKDGKKVVITCIKHASLQIRYDGKEFEVDPVSSAYRPIINYTEKPKAEFILVTHDHYDHFDPNAIFLLTKNNTVLLMPLRCYHHYPRGIIIRNNEKIQLDDHIWVYAVPAYNTTREYWGLHPKGVGNGYIIDLNGFRIYIAGDTEFIPEMKNIKNIDVAFLPCDKPKTMSPAQLRQAAAVIRPKVLFPYHMGQTDSLKIVRSLRGLGIDVRMRFLK